jgi:hypothetical protein
VFREPFGAASLAAALRRQGFPNRHARNISLLRAALLSKTTSPVEKIKNFLW